MANGLEGAVVLGFFALVATPFVAGGIAMNDLQERAVVEVRERIFPTACHTYKGLTTWERWTTPLGWQDGWCDEYLERM
ncbi:hypothetical protein CN198_14335 [Sinorhizobium meliloti]|uniref:hypothetical protein n=1 Tax=Rhizobium meliloti TaxID=382 RepID=UPI000FDC3C15|nr:hypothetical protein [Sinorhizobium meliloti]RVH69233.1 hypothetical protein CN198_14335 [Sinorhizobium meliloti]